LGAPEVQEPACPGRRIIFPQLLKILLEEIGADGAQVVAKQIAETELLLRAEVVFAFENAPAGFFNNGS